MATKDIPRLNFAHLPTPIEALSRLSEALNGPRLLIKRDDQTGLAFGGNKTRKLEFLVAEARDAGAETLITGGALQSNHCRQTAAAAARFGFKCILVLSGDKPQQASGNLLLDQFFGAEIVYVSDRKDRDTILQETFDRATNDGSKPYLIPYGGSNATGARPQIPDCTCAQSFDSFPFSAKIICLSLHAALKIARLLVSRSMTTRCP